MHSGHRTLAFVFREAGPASNTTAPRGRRDGMRTKGSLEPLAAPATAPSSGCPCTHSHLRLDPGLCACSMEKEQAAEPEGSGVRGRGPQGLPQAPRGERASSGHSGGALAQQAKPLHWSNCSSTHTATSSPTMQLQRKPFCWGPCPCGHQFMA